MKHGFLKLCAATPEVRVADIKFNTDECISLTKAAAAEGARVIVFPELSISSATAGDLFLQSSFVSAVETEVERYLQETAELEIISFIGAPVRFFGKLYNSVIVTLGGEILGICPKANLTFAEERYFSYPTDDGMNIEYAGQECSFDDSLIFEIEGMDSAKLAVDVGAECMSVRPHSDQLCLAGATVIVCPSAISEQIGRAQRIKSAVVAHSDRCRCVYVYAGAGVGESTTDAVYSGNCFIAERGNLLAENRPFVNEALHFAIVDLGKIEHDRLADDAFLVEPHSECSYIEVGIELCDCELSNIDKSPLVPKGEVSDAVCSLVLSMQAHALARRLESARAERAVIGVSGGLDSTLALLVCAEAMDILGRDRSNIVALTMPCFGTTKRTKSNALRLSEELGTSVRTVDIKRSVLSHFKDIGHAEDDYSVVYENAQARERTQVLMDVANQCGGIVVGTGDLSELALGFATYNGDQMSMYGVNSGVPKTLLRHLVAYYAKTKGGRVERVLLDILATPVSPELLPPKDGEIAQCTEGIVGPYELHDFFLYYFVRYGYAPSKIKRLALAAFEGEYDEATIVAWLKVFLRRFVTQQFKRSASPDGVKIGSVALSPRTSLMMPSDASFDFLIRELDAE